MALFATPTSNGLDKVSVGNKVSPIMNRVVLCEKKLGHLQDGAPQAKLPKNKWLNSSMVYGRYTLW